MGYQVILDILGAIVVGTLLLLIVLRMSDSATQNTYTYAGELIVQENIVSVVTLLEHDFRKIGYCKDYTQIPDPSASILAAAQDSISFLTDLDYNGQLDTVSYFLGDTTELSMTPNPRDKMLYRVQNSEQPKSANLGITEFFIIYFDALGDQISFPISSPGEINTMQINIKVENTAAYDTLYSSAFWRQIRLAARNLHNR